MQRFLLVIAIALAAAVGSSESASAQYPGNLGFIPYGFYQPYGVRYSSTVRTPPYFALNPPVYYGARHARPYGASPFASPPLVRAGEDYETRLRTQFEQPLVPTPGPAATPLCNPYIHCASHRSEPTAKKGPIRTNPFVTSDDRIAQN